MSNHPLSSAESQRMESKLLEVSRNPSVDISSAEQGPAEGVSGEQDVGSSMNGQGAVPSTQTSAIDEPSASPLDVNVCEDKAQGGEQCSDELTQQGPAYTRLLEDRVTNLETRLERIEKREEDQCETGVSQPISRQSTPRTASHEAGTRNPKEDLTLGLNRMTWQQFKPKESSSDNKESSSIRRDHKPWYEYPDHSRYIIDVVFREAHIKQKEEHTASHTEHVSDPRTNDTPQPERVRINSILLLEALENISGQRFTRTSIDYTYNLLSQVFLRPFKLFVTYEKEIRAFAAELAAIHNSKVEMQICEDDSKTSAQKTGSSPPQEDAVFSGCAPKTSDGTATFTGLADQNPLSGERCWKELKILLGLFDTYLKPVFDLRKCIQDGSCDRIAFRDLWHLFHAGDIVKSTNPRDNQQLYRVNDIFGGQPFLCSRAEARLEPDEGTDIPVFAVLCFSYVTDGDKVGASQRILDIRWFDGLKAIKSLPIHPIRLSKGSSDEVEMLNKFISRGERTLELASKTNGIHHKRYNGLAVSGDIREEVSECQLTTYLLGDNVGSRRIQK